MCKAKQYISNITNILVTIDAEYEILRNRLSDKDKIENDLLHKLEFESFNASTGYKIAKALKVNRAERREIKNELESLTELRTLTHNYDKGLNKIDIKINSIEHKQNVAQYYPRVIKSDNDFEAILCTQ